MEFDDDHDDDEQEEEDEDEEINLAAPQSYDSVPHPSVRPRIGQLGGGGGGGGNGGSVAVGGPQSAGRKIGVVGTKYRECLKNHAVNIGGYATDGCGEFMPAGEEGTLDALKCAACNCHRNFHRKETDGGGGDHAVSPAAAAAAVGGGVAGVGALYHALPPYYRTPTPTGYLHVATAGGGGMAVHSPSPAGAHLHRPLALPSPSGGTHSRDEMDDMSHPSSSGGGGGGGGGGSGLNYSGGGSMGKKRFRTKFSQEQKDKMLAFAEKLGWRMQKHDEAAVQQFCQEVQVKRQVLKVWMHNNKHTLGKKA